MVSPNGWTSTKRRSARRTSGWFLGQRAQGAWSERYGFFGQIGLTAGLKPENAATSTSREPRGRCRCQGTGLLSDLMTPQGQIIDNEGDIAKSPSRDAAGNTEWAGRFSPRRGPTQQRVDGQAWRGVAPPQRSFSVHGNRISPSRANG